LAAPPVAASIRWIAAAGDCVFWFEGALTSVA
jgi:hypothetical protein